MNDNDKFDAFDFIINEEDEVMLLLYAREGEAKDAVIEINADNRSAVLYRNEEDGVVIDRIPDDAFDSLQDADSLMVCELSREEKEEDVEIVRAYEADIVLYPPNRSQRVRRLSSRSSSRPAGSWWIIT